MHAPTLRGVSRTCCTVDAATVAGAVPRSAVGPPRTVADVTTAPSGRAAARATARSPRSCSAATRRRRSTMFLQAAALGKQIYDITDSELALGLLGLVEFLPALILLPLTGSAADRFDRRRVAAIALGGRGADVGRLYCVYAASRPDVGGADLPHRRRVRHRPRLRRAVVPLDAAAHRARGRAAPPHRPLLGDVAVRADRRPGGERLPVRRRPDGAVPRRRGRASPTAVA